MNKTGLEKMVAWLEKEKWDSAKVGEYKQHLQNSLEKSRQLLREEQAQKHTDMAESLAELADSKGCDKVEIYMRTKEEPCMIFFYGFKSDIENESSPAIGETYAKAEYKARKYLNTLPDKDAK